MGRREQGTPALCGALTCLMVAAAVLGSVLLFWTKALAVDAFLTLPPLIAEALHNNHEIVVAHARWKTASYKIPQATSLPDPMVMVGYQNEGWDKYTYGEMQGAQWMYSVAQMFPYPGKLGLKGEMAAADAASLEAGYRAARLKVIATVKEFYFDLFLAYKDLDLIRDKTALFARIEDAAVARYASGLGGQQEVLMAQTEKFMLLEKETMLRQKVQSLEAMLTNAVGRDSNLALGRPMAPTSAALPYSMEELQRTARENSPELQSKTRMISSAASRVSMANKEYYPDVTVAASLAQRTGEFQDMWSLTATFNIPLFYRSKQRQAVLEAESLSLAAQHELEGSSSMLSSGIRDNYAMVKTAEKLMALYQDGLIPKTRQDFELALAGYGSGKIEAITVISRLKSLLDYETLYWGQFVEREKAVARLESIAGVSEAATMAGSQ
ncbi:MAG: hypothetical protein COX17_05560 [Deltaproteobacteria bacterium CG23_combo_of_CG06-09_8_20_14_all_60_8]|nr:MAG: hypothetical protein AUK28_04185 [Desulfobacterales bacterium CG2_30_60_27]PIP43703.1 MAG: hypothetical protein COX17_05560 [Deltaproteobacteria bacterium CG23_combo_of_CG06-09_8_20_14_all_60_8]